MDASQYTTKFLDPSGNANIGALYISASTSEKRLLHLHPIHTSCSSRCSPILNGFNFGGINVNSFTIDNVTKKLY
ncbi:hypothetical protein Tco_1090620 [Tanacetum coccineum]|uniref:Legume lectin domain-containing protein n=1 Tax=Tanacetum coccineum TaxID=301880 RepID=A0ABQ5I4R7_9ASTR